MSVVASMVAASGVLDALKGAGAFVLVLLVVVIVHEFGHFAVGKLSGVRIDEFAVGFGPRVWSVRRGETVYALRLIPAGGFVRLAGMTGLENDNAGERSFYRATIPRKMATIAAGGLINLLLAGVLFGIVSIPGQAAGVTPNAPASSAGIHDGDQIVAVSGRAVNADAPDEVIAALHRATDATEGNSFAVNIVAAGGGTVRRVTVTPVLALYNQVGDKADASGGGYLPLGQLQVTMVNGEPVGHGVPAHVLGDGGAVRISGHAFGSETGQFNSVLVRNVATASDGNPSGQLGKLEAGWRIGYSAGRPSTDVAPAIWGGITSIPSQIGNMAGSLKDVVSTPGSGGLTGPQGASGPVGIYSVTSGASQSGWLALAGIAALISLNLGVVNLLPIPFLDGGRFVFIVIEAVRRRRVDPRVEAMVHVAGLAVIMCFALYITIFGDIGRLINPS